MAINYNEIYNSVIADINEDAMIAGDSGVSGDNTNEIVSGKGDNTSAEILGKCDHKNDGYFSAGCFHVPQNILKYKKKSNKKPINPYLSRMSLVNETELTAEILNSIHSVSASSIISFINLNYCKPVGHIINKIINIKCIAYDTLHKCFWIKCIDKLSTTYFTQVLFDIKTQQFIPLFSDLLTIDDIDKKYSKNFSSMNMFIIWQKDNK